MKLINKILITCIFLGFTCHANAWFFFFLPGSATRAIGDAFTGAKGNMLRLINPFSITIWHLSLEIFFAFLSFRNAPTYFNLV